MLLSKEEIRKAVDAGDIGIDPILDDDRIQPSSVDLRLGPALLVYPMEPVRGVTLDPRELRVMDYARRNCDRVDLTADRSYAIPPNGFVLGATLERVAIPLTLAARVEGKSTLARLGLMVHITAPKIDPGFRGSITLEMFNLGRFALTLSYGMDICALMFEQLGRPTAQGYAGQYQAG